MTRYKWIMILVACGMSTTGLAQDRKYHHEVTSGTDSTLRFGGGSTTFGLDLGYRFLIWPEGGMQAGYATQLDYSSDNTGSRTNWTNLFGVRYNFATVEQTPLIDRLFFDLGLGFRYDRTTLTGLPSTSTTRFVYEAGVGKRFELSSQVSYSPKVGIQKVEGQPLAFVLTPIAISVFLTF